MKLNVPFFLLFSFIFSECQYGNPDWQIIPQDYEFSATIAATSVFVDNIEQTGGKLAAFVGDEIRAVDLDGASLFPPTGSYIYELSIWSNQLQGEEVTFKYYSNDDDLIIDLSETYIFSSDDVVGDAFDAFIMNGESPDCENESNNYFGNPAANTGVSELIILSSNISTLDIGDQIGIFDYNGITSDDCSSTTGEILVGVGEWNNEQLEITASSSIDFCDFANTELPGFVEDNQIYLKVYDVSEEVEYETSLSISQGSINFEETSYAVISDITLGYLGCTDTFACNYDPEATLNDDSCFYAQQNYDCDGNCMLSVDCLGICGGSASIDECNICDGDGPNYECYDETLVCHSSQCNNSNFPFPDLFDFVNSTGSAFYYITDAQIDGLSLQSDDWIGAFNGGTCVGARQWDTNLCTNGVCDIALMGYNSLDDETNGYMQNGDIPTFIIYDHSENTYFNAVPSINYPWENSGIFIIDNLISSDLYCFQNYSCEGCMDESACNYDSSSLIDNNNCHYFEINLIHPQNNEFINLLNFENFENISLSWTEINESCSSDITYEIQIFDQNFNTLFNDETNSTSIDVPLEYLNVVDNQVNLYSWFVNVDNSVTSETFYFYLENFNMSSEISIPFELYQNYPNPFNPITDIKFSIPKYDYVSLDIFDIYGNKIENLHVGYLTPGTYDFKWHAQGFSNGLYVYQLTYGKKKINQKMILLK